MKRLSARYSMLFACAVVSQAVYAQSSQPDQRVDALFAEYTRGLRPGLAVAVVRDGKVLLTRGYGYASLEHRAPITPSTVFDVASVDDASDGDSLLAATTWGVYRSRDDGLSWQPTALLAP